MKKDSKQLGWLLCGTAIAMIPAYFMRFTESSYMYFYNAFTTYPGDLWNFFTNYLGKGLQYPPEYPAGLRFFYEMMGFYRYDNYTLFFTVNTLILGTVAIATTYLLYSMLKKRAAASGMSFSSRSMWIFWILAPTFMFYGTVNYDIPIVFLILLSVYLYSEEKYYSSIFWLAVGMVAKVFPVFLLPLFIWRAPKTLRLRMIMLFGAVVLILNLPYMLMDFHAWIYPYLWQISSNLTTGMDQGTYWWIVYPIAGRLTGWLSLGIFGGLYFLICRKMKNGRFFDQCLAVIILFLLTDRIYSPQYTLYLLPFLALASFPISKKVFYSIDIPNVLLVLFLFYLKAHPLYLQTLVFFRYGALILVLMQVVRMSKDVPISNLETPAAR